MLYRKYKVEEMVYGIPIESGFQVASRPLFELLCLASHIEKGFCKILLKFRVTLPTLSPLKPGDHSCLYVLISIRTED